MMAFRVLVMHGCLLVATSGSSLTDLQRAQTKVPRAEFIGHGFADMGAVLSKHFRTSLPLGSVRDCEAFTIQELRPLQTKLAQVAEQALLVIYSASQDNRRERHASVQAMNTYWDQLLRDTPEKTHNVLRDALCHDVVMRFVHHTGEQTRLQFATDPNLVLPTLPTMKHKQLDGENTTNAFREYVAASGCQACHSRLVPLPDPMPTADCETQLTTKCFKRGQLGQVACTSCVAEHSSALTSCTSQESAAWCDHPVACIGADECPIWPKEFQAPFTLHSSVPPINGAKSNFYYKYTADTQVQTVDYYEKCFPFVNARSVFSNLPCKLFFQPAGIYLSQPGRVDCCKFVSGVGAVPPEFLQSYTYKGPETAPDMYGNTVQCDRWDGPDGFKYWTVGHNDTVYKNFGHDIVFQDGPTGVTWRWGNFTVAPQPDSLFALPAGDCEQSCPKFLEASDVEGLLQDPHVRRSVLNQRLARDAPKHIIV